MRKELSKPSLVQVFFRFHHLLTSLEPAWRQKFPRPPQSPKERLGAEIAIVKPSILKNHFPELRARDWAVGFRSHIDVRDVVSEGGGKNKWACGLKT